jgi:CheY-like chemotaxis protein
MSANVLLVDDTKEILIFVMMMLNDTGLNIDTAQPGLQALERLDENILDLIVLDIMMPEMNGIEFCQRVRASERFADIPIIIATTKGDDEMRKLAFEAGCIGFVTKPLDKTELLSKINEHIS